MFQLQLCLSLLLLLLPNFSASQDTKGNKQKPPITKEWYPYLNVGAQYMLEPSPPNLPSVQLSEEEEKKIAPIRKIYGGKKDKPHLGGFTEFDPMGVSENAFNFLMGRVGVKSVVDVGCGRGHSTRYFMENGAKVLCVEGSHDAVTQSTLPANRVVEHDFTRGPWWPSDTYDLAWGVEFLEHVGRHYIKNYLPIFHKSAFIFVTSSTWGGWHHVEVHPKEWWQNRMTANGFVYSRPLTEQMKKHAMQERGRNSTYVTKGQNLWYSGMVFINPRVASLPEHSHLMSGNGCYGGVQENLDGGKECTGVDALPPGFEPLLDCRAVKKNYNLLDCKKNPRATRVH